MLIFRVITAKNVSVSAASTSNGAKKNTHSTELKLRVFNETLAVDMFVPVILRCSSQCALHLVRFRKSWICARSFRFVFFKNAALLRGGSACLWWRRPKCQLLFVEANLDNSGIVDVWNIVWDVPLFSVLLSRDELKLGKLIITSSVIIVEGCSWREQSLELYLFLSSSFWIESTVEWSDDRVASCCCRDEMDVVCEIVGHKGKLLSCGSWMPSVPAFDPLGSEFSVRGANLLYASFLSFPPFAGTLVPVDCFASTSQWFLLKHFFGFLRFSLDDNCGKRLFGRGDWLTSSATQAEDIGRAFVESGAAATGGLKEAREIRNGQLKKTYPLIYHSVVVQKEERPSDWPVWNSTDSQNGEEPWVQQSRAGGDASCWWVTQHRFHQI